MSEGKAASAAELRGEGRGGRPMPADERTELVAGRGEKDLSRPVRRSAAGGPLLPSREDMDIRDAADVAKALNHPLRIEFLRTARGRQKVSPSEYARETGEPLGNVSYHATMLAQAGVLAVVDTAKRRGAVEHYYAVQGPRAEVTLALMDLLTAA
jgi:DNA-binding transcriptional ArsR family regulator